MSHTMQNLSRKIRLSTILYMILIVVLGVFSLSLMAVYTSFGSLRSISHAKNVFPYPIVVIEHRSGITSRTLAQNMVAVRRFYEVQDFSEVGIRVDFSTEDGQKRFKVREKEVLNKMIEDKAIERVATERGIRVSRDEASQNVARKLSEYNSEAGVTEELERLYGWTIDNFEEKVVVPSLYQEKLEKSIEEELRADAKRVEDKILTAQKSLRSGESFVQVAKNYSDGAGKENGGDIGWFAPEDILPALVPAMIDQKVGVPGDVVESPLGFHIILVEEVKSENEKNIYHLKQVFIRKKTFADFLSEKMQGLSVYVLSPEYIWNKQTARVEFQKQEMRDFEKNLYEKIDGDAAFLF